LAHEEGKVVSPKNRPLLPPENIPGNHFSCLHFEVVGGLEWSNDPESYAGGSIATARASLAGKVKGDDSD